MVPGLPPFRGRGEQPGTSLILVSWLVSWQHEVPTTDVAAIPSLRRACGDEASLSTKEPERVEHAARHEGKTSPRRIPTKNYSSPGGRWMMGGGGLCYTCCSVGFEIYLTTNRSSPYPEGVFKFASILTPAISSHRVLVDCCFFVFSCTK